VIWILSLCYCLLPENIHPPPPTEGTFALDPPLTPLEFPFQGMLVIPHPLPSNPGISIIVQLVLVPSEKNICVKNVVALFYIAWKMIYSAIK